MVAIIVVASVGGGVMNNYIKMKRETAGQEEGDLDNLQEVDELRRRIEVLEEIVTDQKYQLKSELDALERNNP